MFLLKILYKNTKVKSRTSQAFFSLWHVCARHVQVSGRVEKSCCVGILRIGKKRNKVHLYRLWAKASIKLFFMSRSVILFFFLS